MSSGLGKRIINVICCVMTSVTYSWNPLGRRPQAMSACVQFSILYTNVNQNQFNKIICYICFGKKILPFLWLWRCFALLLHTPLFSVFDWHLHILTVYNIFTTVHFTILKVWIIASRRRTRDHLCVCFMFTDNEGNHMKGRYVGVILCQHLFSQI